MQHTGAPMSPSGARRRWAMVAGVVLALAAFLAWRRSAPRAPAAAASQPASLPAERIIPSPAPRPQLAAPAIQLAKRVEIRAARSLAPGALEGTVLDAETNAGIAGAELTFSYDNGAWSTTTGPGGAFRFAPRTTATYRLVSIEARGYASFEGGFGSSPVSFTSTEGSDISDAVLRLTPEDKARPRRRGRRSGSDRVDAGDIAPAARGSLRGRVFDARTGEPVWPSPSPSGGATESPSPGCLRRRRSFMLPARTRSRTWTRVHTRRRRWPQATPGRAMRSRRWTRRRSRRTLPCARARASRGSSPRTPPGARSRARSSPSRGAARSRRICPSRRSRPRPRPERTAASPSNRSRPTR